MEEEIIIYAPDSIPLEDLPILDIDTSYIDNFEL